MGRQAGASLLDQTGKRAPATVNPEPQNGFMLKIFYKKNKPFLFPLS